MEYMYIYINVYIKKQFQSTSMTLTRGETFGGEKPYFDSQTVRGDVALNILLPPSLLCSKEALELFAYDGVGGDLVC